MMSTLSDIYHPITATPFTDTDEYCEIPPCDALKPYICCFWGTKHPVKAVSDGSQGIIIPDTCMDIVFDINYTHNIFYGSFCGIDDRSFTSVGDNSGDTIATFAIRFYPWAALLFAEDKLCGSKNQFLPVEQYFGRLKTQIEPLLFDIPTLSEKAAAVECFLLEVLNKKRINNDLMNSIHYMISSSGRAKISDICTHSVISERQLERIFDHNIGISPKTFSSLIRYQLLWQEMVYSDSFSILDAVEKYGYTDQAHLLNDFKKRHTMSPSSALKTANLHR